MRCRRFVSRVLVPPVLTMAAVAACGQDLSGSPVPAAGFEAPSHLATAVPGPSAPEGPSAPTPRQLDGTDLCTLLTAGDLASLGGLRDTPKPTRDVFPESCSFPIGGGAASDTALVAFYKPYDQVREQQPQGHQEETGGYPTWVYCAVTDGYQTCTAAVAARPDRSLLVAVSRRDVSAAKVISVLQPLTTTVLNRLPPG